MGAVHDNLTNEIGTFVLNKIRVSDPDWRQVFSTSVNRIGSWDWPRADYIMEDNKLGITYAHEFKPPFQTKREYLTGLGQSMCYLNNFDYAGIYLYKI